MSCAGEQNIELGSRRNDRYEISRAMDVTEDSRRFTEKMEHGI